jgi:hypothetical protein
MNKQAAIRRPLCFTLRIQKPEGGEFQMEALGPISRENQRKEIHNNPACVVSMTFLDCFPNVVRLS